MPQLPQPPGTGVPPRHYGGVNLKLYYLKIVFFINESSIVVSLPEPSALHAAAMLVACKMMAIYNYALFNH